jgi:hypothetical protein
MNKKHFDAWGHPVSDFMSMIRYYSGDKRSQDLLRKYGLLGVVCIPAVELRLDLPEAEVLTMSLMYPAGNVIKRILLADRGLDSLRRLYVTSEVQWRHSRGENCIIWKRSGRLVRAVWTNNYAPPLSY